MICSKCGKENIPGSTFCQYCGNTLNAQTTAAQNIPAQYAPGMQQNPIPPANPAIGTYAPAAPAAQKKNKKTAIIITVVCLVIVLAAGIFIGISMNKKREAEAETTVVTQSANETTEQNDAVKLFLRRNIKGSGIITAEGYQTAEGFVVLKGSHISPEDDDSIFPAIKARRREVKVDSEWVLQEDVLCRSPSFAAMLVIGKRANGLTSWKTHDGRTLKSLETTN